MNRRSTPHMAKDNPYSWIANFSSPVWPENSHLQIDKGEEISQGTTFLPRNSSSHATKKVKHNPEGDGTHHYGLLDEIAATNCAYSDCVVPSNSIILRQIYLQTSEILSPSPWCSKHVVPNNTVSQPESNHYTDASFAENIETFLRDGNFHDFQSNPNENQPLILNQKGGYSSDHPSNFFPGECSIAFDSDKSRPSPESSVEKTSVELGAMGLRPYNNPVIDNYSQENVNYYGNPYYMNAGNSVAVPNHLSQPAALLKKSKHSSRKSLESDCSPPELSLDQRSQANDRERQRTRQMNTAFARLRKAIPSQPSDKLSKRQTLELAQQYITFLQEQLAVGCDLGHKSCRCQASVRNFSITCSHEGLAKDFTIWRMQQRNM
ncbi:hypothetical protein CDAR_587241 [Caerostris darwini]|uniref:BHLH domain-containing protein n=1 Tax=Caerostris darwini TaxID=1538125 RepID=A0AAV4WII1_9ARAC|nr:hypothetical protein CDAR_587241 [Caerostris darwini]